MKAFKGYEDAVKAAQYNGSAQIPAGAYVCKILNVKFEEGQNGGSDRIAIQFDVVEGEHKDFFKNQYDNNINEDKKWKGSTRIYVPTDDGSEQDGWTKNAFARWTNSFEKSNAGYAWDWDESKWKDKLIGLVFGPTGTVIDGKEVTYSEVHGCCSVDEVKEGTFYKKYLDLRKKNGFTGNGSVDSAANDFVNAGADNSAEEIPF